MNITDRIWHYLYCRWYDNDRAGNRLTAFAWGRAADWWCRAVWP